MVVLGPRLLPSAEETPVTPPAAMRQYLSEIAVLAGSPLIGQRAFAWELLLIDCRILKVIRGDEAFLPSSEVILREGDALLVEGKVDNLMKVRAIEGIEIRARAEPGDAELEGADIRIAETVLLPGCELVGRTLVESDFRQRYGLQVLAVNHQGSPMVDKLGEITLRVGDVLLVQGRQDRVAARTFAIAVMLAASISFITPFEPASLIVYSQGKYRFADFAKIGGGLTLVLAVVTLLLLPFFWPLR